MEKVAYAGWENNLKIANGDAGLIVTLDVGPRILSYSLVGGANVFKEFAGQLGRSGEGRWMARGGHRLWAAPEDPARTYAPDNGPVEFAERGPGAVALRPKPEAKHGIQKELEVALEPTGSRVTVIHRITNIGREPTELAPWALSVMAPGGVEIIPMPPGRPHPGPPEDASSPADFAPDRRLVLWPFFDFTDPRWEFGSRFLRLRQDEDLGPTKIGLAHRAGWVGYLNRGTLFVKRFAYREGATYPDGGCNFETFADQEMLEMESLGPLVTLGPGQAAEHVERWELIPGLGAAANEGLIERTIVPRLGVP